MICWTERYRYEPCDHRHDGLAYYGRCRSGGRWFWATWLGRDHSQTLEQEHGWSADEAEALIRAKQSVERLAKGCVAVVAAYRAGTAVRALKDLNAEKRKARPGPRDRESKAVEYLYGLGRSTSDYGPEEWWVESFPIIKKTAKRIYYVRHPGHSDVDLKAEIGFVNRQDLESKGEVWRRTGGWWETDFHLFQTPPELPHQRYREPSRIADLKRLKREMADAHPDRGGSDAVFIAARERYAAAKARAS